MKAKNILAIGSILLSLVSTSALAEKTASIIVQNDTDIPLYVDPISSKTLIINYSGANPIPKGGKVRFNLVGHKSNTGRIYLTSGDHKLTIDLEYATAGEAIKGDFSAEVRDLQGLSVNTIFHMFPSGGEHFLKICPQGSRCQ